MQAGDPNKGEPDVIYREAGGQTIGIEVVTAYYEDADAKDTAQIAAGENPLGPNEIRERSGGLLVNPDRTICERIQKELEKKCRKTYAGVNQKWLCINQDAALSDAVSVAECIKSLRVPEMHEFTRIYLSYIPPNYERGAYKVDQIYP